MDFAKLNPWNWFKKEDEQEKTLPVARSGEERDISSLAGLHTEIDRLFDSMFRGFGAASHRSLRDDAVPSAQLVFKPRVDIAGSDTEYVVTAEIPGMEGKDIHVEVQGDDLVIQGEKQQEDQSEGKGWYSVERSYGAFRRVLTLPEDADVEHVKASYRRGVLTLSLPRRKTAAEPTRRIQIDR